MSTCPNTIRRSNFLYRAAIFAILSLYLGYTLNPLTNFTYHKAVRHELALEGEKHQLQMNYDEAVWDERRARREEQERQSHEDEMKKRKGWALEVAKYQALRLQMEYDEAVWRERRVRHKEQERQRHNDEMKKREGIS